MNVKDTINHALLNYSIEDRQIILMQLEEKAGLTRYSRKDYKKAYAVRKKIRRRRLKSEQNR